MAHLVSKKDENNGQRISRASEEARGGHCQNEEDNMNLVSSHQKRLFLFLMTIPVELLFVFVLSHLLSAFLDHASHALPSFLFVK
jgi:F0F1-type ATP synthase assembly protein I